MSSTTKTLTVNIERTDRGLRFTCPALPGWAFGPVRANVAIAEALAQAFIESDIADYARKRGEVYDLEAHDTIAAQHASRGGQMAEFDPDAGHDMSQGEVNRLRMLSARAEAQHAGVVIPLQGTTAQQRAAQDAAWAIMPDGRWKSPKGYNYDPQSTRVQGVVRRRRQLGLPVTYDEQERRRAVERQA